MIFINFLFKFLGVSKVINKVSFSSFSNSLFDDDVDDVLFVVLVKFRVDR